MVSEGHWENGSLFFTPIDLVQSLAYYGSLPGMGWMKLEPIIQREVSQKDKDQYSILTHIYGI